MHCSNGPQSEKSLMISCDETLGCGILTENVLLSCDKTDFCRFLIEKCIDPFWLNWNYYSVVAAGF